MTHRGGDPPNEKEWERLARDLAARVEAFAPDWTHGRDRDPGITIAELIGFLGESLLARSEPTRATRARLVDVVTKLGASHALPCRELSPPTRVRYFTGRLLSPADFELEQDYVRGKQRRHNLLLHGTGVVRGLDVTIESGASGGPEVVVAPGLAIAPDGEELLLCDHATRPLNSLMSPSYVTLRLMDRPVALVPTPDGEEASRIDEVVELQVVPDPEPSDLALARLEQADGAWRLDPSFKAPRLDQ